MVFVFAAVFSLFCTGDSKLLRKWLNWNFKQKTTKTLLFTLRNFYHISKCAFVLLTLTICSLPFLATSVRKELTLFLTLLVLQEFQT